MSARERTTKPTVAQLRAVGQPPEVLARYNAEHWAGRVYMRRVSVYATWVLVRLGVPANVVTFGMALVGLIGAAAFSGQGVWWPLAGALLIQLYLLLDCSDGEIARWSNTTGPTGVFLDRLGHYVVEGALLIAAGLRAGEGANEGWTIAGMAAALLALLTKVETDLVEVARAKAGLGASNDAAVAPRATGLARIRRLAGMLPVNRLLGAIEASFVLLAAAFADQALGDLRATRWVVTAMIAIGVYTFAGHLFMILASNRLRA